MFDSDGNFKTQFTNVGTPTAICVMHTGRKQVLYVAHTGDPDGMEDAAIYKLDLKGNVHRQIRQRRQTSEGIRPRELDRLPQRE